MPRFILEYTPPDLPEGMTHEDAERLFRQVVTGHWKLFKRNADVLELLCVGLEAATGFRGVEAATNKRGQYFYFDVRKNKRPFAARHRIEVSIPD